MKVSSFSASKYFPTEPQQICVGRQTVSMFDCGEGPPLLLLHAAPAWTFIYREFLAELAPHFRCLAVDLPGFGFSPEPPGAEPSLSQLSRLVEDLIHQLDLQNLTILVHDSSGCIGLGAAGRLPERIRGLIITDTFAWPLRNDFSKIRFMLRLVTHLPFSLLQTWLNIIPWAAITTATGREISKQEKSDFLTAFSTLERRARVLHLFRGLLRENDFLEDVEWNLERHLAGKPALVMFGEKDPARKAGFEDRWRTILKNASFEVLPNQMHFPHFGVAKEMCKEILEWSDSLEQD